MGFRSIRTCPIVNDPDEKTVSILARIFETSFSLEPVLGGEKKEERPAFADRLALHDDDLVAFGADRNVLDGGTHKLGEPLAVDLGILGKIFPLPCIGGVAHPPVILFVDRLGDLLLGCLGKVLDDLPVDLVGDTDLQLLEAVQDVELGKGDAGKAVYPTGVVGGNSIEPTTAAGTAGCCTKLLAYCL